MIICMGMSLQARVALLPEEERRYWLSKLHPSVLEEILRGEWWWTARPEQVPPPGDWFIALALAGRGFGKAISVDTLMPTPQGWMAIGDLKPGDEVLDRKSVV